MCLERALVKLGFYRHHTLRSNECGGVSTPWAWVNRITCLNSIGQPVDEIWLIRLPNWNYFYQPAYDKYMWAQKYVKWSATTGKGFVGSIPV